MKYIYPSVGREHFNSSLYRELLGASPLEHVDHSISIKMYGTNHLVNLDLLPAYINLAKGSNSWIFPVISKAVDTGCMFLPYGIIEGTLCYLEGNTLKKSLARGISSSALSMLLGIGLTASMAWGPTAILASTAIVIGLPLGTLSLSHRIFKIFKNSKIFNNRNKRIKKAIKRRSKKIDFIINRYAKGRA